MPCLFRLRTLWWVLLSLARPAAAAPATPTPTCGVRHAELFTQGTAPVAYTQVWDITAEGGDGCRVFFATNDGLCIYDGVRWECLHPSGNPVLRALRYDAASERLYTAGVNEFGYWQRDPYGGLAYTLLYRNPDFRSQSNDFWRIAIESRTGRVFFQCPERICLYDPPAESIRELLPQHVFRYMYEVAGRIYFQDGPTLCRLTDDLGREAVCEVPSRIINLLAGRDGELLAAVEHVGLLVVDAEGRIAPLDAATNACLAEAKITCCRRYGADRLLVGTTRRGLFLIGRDGSLDRSVPWGDRLDRTTILSVASDERGDLWLGLDSGAACIDNSTQDYYLADADLGQVHTVLGLSDGRMLVGSNKGLFCVDGAGTPQPVAGSTGSVWGLEEVDGSVYVLHDQGLFRLTGSLRLDPVLTGSGVYSMHRCRVDARSYILSTYSGLARVRRDDRGLRFVGRIAGYNGFTRDFRIDDEDRIWVTILGVGFVRLTLSEDRSRVVDVRNCDLMVDAADAVFSTRLDQELLLCCGERAWRIDRAGDSLVRAPAAERILSCCGPGVRSLVQDGNRFWYVAADGAGYVERSGAALHRCAGVLEHAVRERISTAFRVVGGAGALGFRNGVGFCRGGAVPREPVGIGRVAAQGPRAIRYHRLADEVFEIPASMNTLLIWPVHPGPGRRLEYRIASLSSEWQSVCVDERLAIPALPPGRHRIELRTPGTSSVCRLEVRVRPPWYIAGPAIGVYVLAIGLLLAGVRSYYLSKSRRVQSELHRREQQRREKELEQLERENLLKEKRIAELERERLKTDLRNKDKRLAHITMNSIRRNNMLNELKSEVAQLTAVGEEARVKSIAGRIVRQINAQLKDDSDWQLSENYFNTIYDGLLDRLRERYPTLSQTDLRLCVYIKLNLSTKETAGLMNISPRSVEMARYRLRKKLGLGPNESIGSVLQ